MAEELQVVARRNPTHAPTLREIAAVFFRHKRLLQVSFLVALGAGIIYAIASPSYQAEMKILLRRGRIDPAITPASGSAALQRDEVSEEDMNSEVELLHDQDLIRNVVVDSGLASRASWVSRLRGDDEDRRIERAVRQLSGKLQVQLIRKSRLITISCASSDPRLSAAVLRNLADAYLAKHAEMLRPSGQQTFFESQMKESRRALQQAQAQLIEFTRRNGVVAADVERDLTLQKLSEAQAADLALQVSVAGASERLRSLTAKLQDLPERRVVQIKNTDNAQLQEKLKSKLLELQLRRTELMTKFQPSYRLVQEIDLQITQAKSAIEAEDLKPLRDETTEQDPDYEWAHSEKLKNQVELQALEQKQGVARTQVIGYRISAQKFGENAIAQHDLERKLKAAEEKYLLYASKHEEARVSDALDENGILNVAIAQPPRAPALPLWSVWTATCLSFVGAGVFSTGLVFVADYFDPTFRTPAEVLEFLGTPVLGSLPPRTPVRSIAGGKHER